MCKLPSFTLIRVVQTFAPKHHVPDCTDAGHVGHWATSFLHKHHQEAARQCSKEYRGRCIPGDV